MVQRMHDIAVGLEWVSPIDFWRMSPGQFWWLYRSKMPKPKQDSERFNELVEWVKAEKAKEAANG